ncbi:LacI family DNA-binding transcriptional regulator [Roseibium polysiphoniae]|uniref:LacI family DNA-binding transcriptional regulator n=1 Tax=Roseibium polysiphoniae TaxID=2571221 RepID=UPI0032995395
MTLREVARQADVSVATVSRVLNGSDKVVPETRDRIQAMIEQLGYLPNPAARTLNSGRTMTVGAIVPTLYHSIFAKFLHGLEKRLSEQGFSLVVSTSDWDQEIEATKARHMLAMGAEALVVSGVDHSPNFTSLVRRYKVPIVQTSYFAPNSEFATIGYDNAKAARTALKYLVGLGHKRISVLHGPEANNDRVSARLQGLRSYGKDVQLDFVETTLDIPGGRNGASTVLSKKAMPSAILCLSDLLAVGALFESQSKGIIIPTELSIMGFENLQIGAVTSPPLTTMSLGVEKMATQTAAALCAHLSENKDISEYEVVGDVIVRGSTARKTKLI